MPCAGISSASARPAAVTTPTRRPVNGPGPRPTPTTSRSVSATPAARQTSSISGVNVSPCALGADRSVRASTAGGAVIHDPSRGTSTLRTTATDTIGVEVSNASASTSDQASRAVSSAAALPLGRALVEEGPHPFLRVVELAARRHHLDGVVVRLALAEGQLRVERLLAERLALGAAAGDAADQLGHGRVELVVRHDAVDQAPLGSGPCVDDVTRHRELERALAPDVARDGDHRRVAEPAALATRRGEA